MIDLSKIKIGDDVLIKGTLFEISNERYCIKFNMNETQTFAPRINKNSIVSFSTPKYEPKAGDVVEFEKYGETHKVEILATHAAHLWVKFPDDSHGIFKISDLKNLRKVGL